MKRFLLLPRDAQDHILLCLQEAGCTAELFHQLLAHDCGRASEALGFFPGTVSAHRNNHTMALTTCKRRPSTWRCSKPPQGQRQVANVPCTPINSTSGQKDFPHLPLPRADSSLHHTPRARQTSLAQTNLFPLADSAHQLETIWQKQSSKQCQLRKLLLPTTSTAPLKLAAHTLFSALSIPPHATLTSAPATLALCPCLCKERHSESLGLALPSVPCLVLLKLPLLCFLCLRLPCLALLTTCWLCFALPTTLALAFHAGKALQSKCRQLWASQGRGKQGQSSEGKANGVVGKRRPRR